MARKNTPDDVYRYFFWCCTDGSADFDNDPSNRARESEKVAAAMWLTQNNKLLLVRRAIEPAKGLWTIPGGFVDAWETPAETASRECAEETGLRVITSKLLDLVPNKNQSSRAGFVIFYTGQIISGDLKAGDDADAVDWFSINQLPEIAFYATQTMINRWKERQL